MVPVRLALPVKRRRHQFHEVGLQPQDVQDVGAGGVVHFIVPLSYFFSGLACWLIMVSINSRSSFGSFSSASG